jgi:tetratricopeptide (TPR) repeat protein
VEVLGLTYQDKGDFTVALPLLEQAFKIDQQSLSEESTKAIQSLNNLAMLRWEMQDSQSVKQLALINRLLSSKIRRIEPDNNDIVAIVETITNDLSSIVASASETSQGAALNRIIGQFDALYVQIERLPSIRGLLDPILQRWRIVVSRVAGQIGRLPTLTLMTSPYIFTVPVQGNQLVGREDLFRRIEALWSRPGQRNSLLIHGHRRMGKTSVAQALQSRCNFGDDTRLCYLSMEGIDLSQEGFLLFEIAYQLYQLCEGRTNEPDENRFLGASPRTAFNRYIQRIDKIIAPLRVILVLDEFERIDRILGRKVFIEIIDFLRAKTQSYHWLALALVGLTDLDDLSRSYQVTVLGWQGIRVSFLSSEQVRQVLVRPTNAPDVFLDYTKEAVQLIADLTNGQPYLVQVIGDRLVEHFNQRLQAGHRNLTARLERADVEAIIDDHAFYDYANAYFSGVWSQFEREQPLLTVVAAHDKGINEEKLRSTLENQIGNFDESLGNLLRHEILFREEGTIRFRVPLMHKWVLKITNQHQPGSG